MAGKQPVSIAGTVAAGFEGVRTAFERNFAQRGEIGAALHVTLEGETVVDLWGGSADRAGTQPWQADTLVNVYSTTKGWLALGMHLLADEGRLDFETPVVRYWPEFAQNGKEKVLVRHLLTHTAGLPAPSMKLPDEAIYDWEAMVHALERSELFWQPGEQCGYHAATFGWLNGEVLRRVSGQTVGAFLRERVAQPLGADVWVGLGPDEMARTAEAVPPGPFGMLLFRLLNSTGDKARKLAFTNPPRKFEEVNTARWRAAQIPSSNGHASARGLARVYTPLALGGTWNGTRLLSARAAELAGREQIHMKDIVGMGPVRRSLGFMLPEPGMGDPRPPSAFGHPGLGGSLGYADPEHRLAFGYVMNKLVIGVDARAMELCKAVYAALKK